MSNSAIQRIDGTSWLSHIGHNPETADETRIDFVLDNIKLRIGAAQETPSTLECTIYVDGPKGVSDYLYKAISRNLGKIITDVLEKRATAIVDGGRVYYTTGASIEGVEYTFDRHLC